MNDAELVAELGRLNDLATAINGTLPEINRSPSKAAIIGWGKSPTAEAGNFFNALARARSRDLDEQQGGKADLEFLGSRFVEDSGKATLGTTNANGGYVLPANVVEAVVEASRLVSPMRDLFTTVSGVNAAGLNIPIESFAPTRASVVAWGETKENINQVYGSYTATMYTIARIYDVSNQLLRHSQGAAETVVRDALARAFGLAEAYYTLSGSGTNEPKGILTTIAAGSASWTTAHSASDSTVAGSVRAAFSKAIEAVTARGWEVTGILCNPGDIAHSMAQGADAAGFWIQDSGVSLTGTNIPIRTSVAIASKTAVVGAFKFANLYLGQGYRVDVSDTAGTRWDTNLTGFRGEEEIGFTADPYVLQGMFQRITGLIP